MSIPVGTLPPLQCPDCGAKLAAHVSHEISETTDQFHAWHRRCDTCGVAYSNALHSPVRIYRDPERNIPIETQDGVRAALEGALNVRNRSNKWAKFGYQTSEDALTWTVFSYLARAQKLEGVMSKLLPGLWPARAQVTTLVWGVPVRPSSLGDAMRAKLENVSDALGEDEDRRSEPDVLVAAEDGSVALIEVKYRSRNDEQSRTYAGWKRAYLERRDAFADPKAVRRSGHYELARYWRILSELAGDRPGALLNLGPKKLFDGDEGVRLTRFRRALAESATRKLVYVPWATLVAAVEGAPAWLSAYLVDKHLG